MLLTTGCEDARKKIEDVGGQISGWIAGMPPDDGTRSYRPQRVKFYEAINSAKRAETMIFGGQLLAGAAGITGAILADSFAAKAASVGVAAAVILLLETMKEDEQRIQMITSALDDLVRARTAERDRINQRVRSGEMTRDEGKLQLTLLSDLMGQDILKAREVNAGLTTRFEGFRLSAEEAQTKAASAPRAERREAQQKAREARAAVQTNQRALGTQTAAISNADGFARRLNGDIEAAGLEQLIDGAGLLAVAP